MGTIIAVIRQMLSAQRAMLATQLRVYRCTQRKRLVSEEFPGSPHILRGRASKSKELQVCHGGLHSELSSIALLDRARSRRCAAKRTAVYVLCQIPGEQGELAVLDASVDRGQ